MSSSSLCVAVVLDWDCPHELGCLGLGQLDRPIIAVRPVDQAGKPHYTGWRKSDAVESWSWGGRAAPAQVEVYSDADEVELIVNGRSAGRRAGSRAGSEIDVLAQPPAPYALTPRASIPSASRGFRA